MTARDTRIEVESMIADFSADGTFDYFPRLRPVLEIIHLMAEKVETGMGSPERLKSMLEDLKAEGASMSLAEAAYREKLMYV